MKEVVSVAKKALNVWKTAGFSVDRTPITRLAWQGLPYLTDSTGGARAPLTVYWSINSVCNLHCRMCDVGTANSDANFWKILRIDKKLHEIPIELFKSVTATSFRRASPASPSTPPNLSCTSRSARRCATSAART
jgi:hypothetical protein